MPIKFVDVNDYSEEFNDEKVQLAKSLINGDDCFLWDSKSLSHLFQVKVDVIKKLVPPTKHQLNGWRIEQKTIDKLSEIDRKRYYTLKDKERNSAALDMYKKKMIPNIAKFMDDIFV
ncbi:hypothetical protein RF11_10760 [Thelohanellus kitauei]|uniref:Uncharacterized protein n=1 Tax=Thelohanellus kitauei TaxID=669202 RepID=A0A0C2II68_THEKT|nr:hypothetical protein RF11_10760 [Thelohanellus kitauei]